ncbi:UNVERIFIED_CONTAM: hypothetical protein Slati_2749900 [Sesamum latifolium]|uniref:Uncharacterized protein n=1 Tax=Sesamum latifolium TaxID=2727402 RepID=A0AAW2W1X7_9LAMI
MTDNSKRLKSDKYCRFHKDRGHIIEDCYHLKNEIEKLIQMGYLKEYVENNPSDNNTAPRRGGKEFEEAESSKRREKGRENLPTTGVIGVVTGGPAGGDSAPRTQSIAFSQMGIRVDMLTKVNTPLVGFNESVVEPMGEIALPISIGTTPHRATRMLKFLRNRGEKRRLPYNKRMHANILKKKSKLLVERKPQIPSGEEKHLEVTRGHSLPPPEQPDQQMKKRRIEEEKLAAAEELKNVQVVEGEPGKVTSVGPTMSQRMEEELVQFLKANSDVFAWTVQDLEGIDPEVMTHKLNVNPTF